MKNNYSGFSRRGPDVVVEEIVEVLSRKASYEFKALFDVVHENLRARNAASGGEEMMRLKTYEKLQNLVGQGAVKKTINGTAKTYQGVASAMKTLAVQLKTMRADAVKRMPVPAAKE